MKYFVEPENGYSDFYYCSLREYGTELPHIHSHLELVFAISNSTNVIINEKQFHIQKGHVLLIKPFEPHKRSNDINVFTLACPIEYAPEFNNILKEKTFNPRIVKLNCSTEQLIKEIIENDSTDFKKKALLYLTLSLFLEQAQILPTKEFNVDIYHKTVIYISKHYSQNLSLSQVAKYIGITKNHLSRLLNAHSNIGFSDLLNSIRIHIARDLIMQTN
ncbi:MAG: helix-turn-helix domain-containing protein, partial [Clostridia bacterium]|nr:helix-turn-helix domain-containing protein [Clostridia bacterium]